MHAQRHKRDELTLDRSGTQLVPDSESMSSVDLAWLTMDRPCNPMVVAAVLQLDPVRSLPRLIDTLATRLHGHPRFRQYADDGCQPAVWVDDTNFERAYHFQIRRSSAPIDDAALRVMIARELSRELDRSRPLWQLSLFRQSRRRVALLFRAHHAMADGVSLMQLLLKLADGAGDGQAASAPQAHHATRTRRGPLAFAIHGLESLDAGWSAIQARLARAREQPADAIRDLALFAAGTASTLRVLSLRDRTPAPFRQALCGDRRIDWSAPLSLEPLHRLAHRHGVSLNDLFLSALAGAFGRYLRAAGPVARRAILRVSIPVDLRSPADGDFGNCFGLVLFDLPVGEQCALRRLALVGRQMRKLKHSQQARAMLMSLRALGHLPVFVEKMLVERVAGKAAAVVSNLRGPDDELVFAGAGLKSVVFWPPQTGEVGIGVSMLSYTGQVTIGLCCDSAVLAEPHRVIAAFQAEIDELLAAG
ncbi:MAG: acyltransferase [Hydrocarboniphaga sp.]|uniref:WS/DGAT domain-containing protein n=1 Tax=Hydrocarboniphaga sp. TaxID=2033016 RepID=UPI00262F0221|nr:WS/DGAT domain-containing protein [Hydrocarboniphaga sp.]MDB5971212.1 acyltransferase [Hydrocarboniphaga sp.]